MAEKSVLNAIKFLGKCLGQHGVRISRIILFGSWAQGSARADSDIDIVVISDDFEGKSIFERAAMLRNARMKTLDRYLYPMDILLKTSGEYNDSLISLYADKGVVAYSSTEKPRKNKASA
jgi:predicted nucleotidyltransferase